MTGVDLLLAIAGGLVTVMVVVGMILITPRGQVEATEADATPVAEPAAPGIASHPAGRPLLAEPARASLAPTEAAVEGTARHA